MGDVLVKMTRPSCKPLPLLVYFIIAALINARTTNASDGSCFHHLTLEDLVDCLTERHFIPKHYFNTSQDWTNRYLPTKTQRWDYQEVIRELIRTTDEMEDCLDVRIPDTLNDDITVRLFTDTPTQREFCVLLDSKLDENGIFKRGWNVFVVPRHSRLYPPRQRHITTTTATATRVHISAPHPIFDYPTALQGAHILANTPLLSKSLLIAAHHRSALSTPRPQFHAPRDACSSHRYSPSDPTHSNTTMFHSAAAAILDYESRSAETTSTPGKSNVVFLQLHAKGERTCVDSDVFMSSGLRRQVHPLLHRLEETLAFVSDAVPSVSTPRHHDTFAQHYHKAQHNRHRTDLHHNHHTEHHHHHHTTLSTQNTSWNINNPLTDPRCQLRGGMNIFGRLINQVQAGEECHTDAHDIGEFAFIHCEQSLKARADIDAWRVFASAVQLAFP